MSERVDDRPPRRLADFPAGHPGEQFLTGRTPLFACRADQRFSYSLYVPDSYRRDGTRNKLIVAVHGTGRRVERLREGLVDFAEETAAVVLTPLFPCGIQDPDDLHNYKFIEYAGIRFDRLLLSMVDEVAARWSIDPVCFALQGFSGGGQFAHRFLYLHPERLSAVSIGAPGRVTLPDPSLPWWQGIGDVAAVLGNRVDLEGVARVPTQVVVGALDNDPSAIATVAASSGGDSRLERATSLAATLKGLGGAVTLDVVSGAGHDVLAVLPAVKDFLRPAVRVPD